MLKREPVDPIAAQVIASALIYASEEMGIALRDAAYSPNIKERLDHSCALFDARGRLVAQAEHIPVHLGSLPWGLRRTLAWLRERGRTIGPGEMIVVNDPYLSGTHLNDVTVIRGSSRQAHLWAMPRTKRIIPTWAERCRARCRRMHATSLPRER